MTHLADLKSDTLKYTGVVLENPHHTFIPKGVTAVVGANGSGKTSLATIIARGANFMTNHIEYAEGRKIDAKIVAFADIYSLTGMSVEYYQQRYESMMNEEVPSIGEMIGDKTNQPQWLSLISLLGLGDILNKKPNYLSSGELRKLLIANALTEHLDLLILDNPYIGLDASSRQVVDDTIRRIAEDGLSVMLLVSDAEDIPEYADAVVPMRGMAVGDTILTEGRNMESLRMKLNCLFDFSDQDLPEILPREHTSDCPVVEMHGCRVTYGERVILNNVEWRILPGEAWALSGPNGSGKSTLLSLINADNPQAYCNDVRLFGRRRGTGESIWDIKERIGYMSSEMHLYFRPGSDSMIEVLYSGLNTALGRYLPVTEQQKQCVDTWLRYFGIEDLAEQRFSTLSFGLQRLTLLIRALLRSPELLILDEPMHGLDLGAKRKALRVIDALSAAGTTIIYVTHTLSDMPRCISQAKVLEKWPDQ